MPGRKKPTAEIPQSIKGVVASEVLRADDARAEAERQEYLGDSRRDQRTKAAVNGVVIAFVVVIGGLIVVATAVVILNLLLPIRYRWLTDDQVQKLWQFLLSGAIGSALRSFVGYLNPKQGNSGRRRS